MTQNNSSPILGEIPYRYRRRIHWGDTDAAGIVYTGNYLQYAMEAIEDWLISVLGQSWFSLTQDRDMGNPVVRCELDFIAPVTPRHALVQTVLVERLGNSSISYLIEGHRSDGVLCCRTRLTAVWILGHPEMKPIPIPLAYRRLIEAYMNACTAHDGHG